MTSIPFNPTPSAQAALLDALTDPAISLPTLPATHKTTTESLAAWITSSDTRARLALIQSAVLVRAQLIAAINQTAAIAAAMGILDAFKNASTSKPSDTSQHEAPTPIDPARTQPPPAPTDASTSSPDRHWCETARRAASLIFRMSQPLPTSQSVGRAARLDSQAALAHPPAARQPIAASPALPASSTSGRVSPQSPADFQISDFRSETQPTPTPQRTNQESPAPLSPVLPATLDSPQPLSALSDFEISDLRSEIQTPPAARGPKRQGARALRRASRLAELAGQTSGP